MLTLKTELFQIFQFLWWKKFRRRQFRRKREQNRKECSYRTLFELFLNFFWTLLNCFSFFFWTFFRILVNFWHSKKAYSQYKIEAERDLLRATVRFIAAQYSPFLEFSADKNSMVWNVITGIFSNFRKKINFLF